MTEIWRHIEGHITRALGRPFVIERQRGVGGGCISSAYVVAGTGGRCFVKLNRAGMAAMFAGEAEGLREIAATGTLRVPRPLCWGTAGDSAYLAMEYLDLGADGARAAAALGRQLAAMHRVTGDTFGWKMDNHIGATPQLNTPHTGWATFWRERRLGYQLELASANGYGGRLLERGERLRECLPAFFDGYSPSPSLLHGDLWSGNWAADGRGAPVVFDPAVYYGDREADIAMTELFGGFPAAFYQAYRAEYPLDSGYPVRKGLYNLYHVLNHLNLFGGAYLGQAQRITDTLLGEVT